MIPIGDLIIAIAVTLVVLVAVWIRALATRPPVRRREDKDRRRPVMRKALGVGSLATLGLTAACGAPAPALNRSAPPLSATVAPTPAVAIPAASTPMQSWCAGSGYSVYQAVAADLRQVQNDLGDQAAEVPDGVQLASDAGKAVQDPPPFSEAHKANYLFAMGFFQAAGRKLASGGIGTAASDLRIAAHYLGGLGGLIDGDCP